MPVIQNGTVIETILNKAFVFDLGAPSVEDTQVDDIHAAVTLTAAAQTVTTDITNPDICRVVAVKGSDAGHTQKVTINGTNYHGEAISEDITLTGTSTAYGTKAFKTITSIVYPAYASGGTVVVGRGKALGLPFAFSSSNKIVAATLGKAAATPTVVTNETDVAKNTVDLSAGTYDGSKRAVVIAYM